ncbi:phage tail assembly chaperone GT [Sporosarcina sp. P21c]
MENGKDINEALAMPFHFVLQILEEKNKPKPSSSFFDLMK